MVRNGEKAEKEFFAGHSQVEKEVHEFLRSSSADFRQHEHRKENTESCVGLATQVCREGTSDGRQSRDRAEMPRSEFPGAYRRKPNEEERNLR